VTHPTSGCTDTAVTNVLQDIIPPADVLATASSNYLNCDNPFVILTGLSSTPGVSFNWTGPGLNSNNDVEFTVIPGTFVFTATNGSNGCSGSDSVIIGEDYNLPDLTAQGATITCSEDTVILTSSSTTPGVNYLWTGPGLIGSIDLPNAQANVAGEYTITIKNPVNGCTNTAIVFVAVNKADPDLTTSADDTITCYDPSVTLSASSATPGVSITWTGYPGQNPISVSSPGTYVVTALNPANGCDITKNVVVTKDVSIPALSIDASETNLTCLVISATLTASSTTPGTNLQWTGFGIGANPIVVSNSGTYRVFAQKTSNGCINTDSVIITQDVQTPDLVTQSATITCNEQIVTISASSTTLDATYLWSENVIISDPTLSNVDVFSAEDYSVTVTNPANGCTNSETVTVDLDNQEPTCNIITPSGSPIELQNNTISCQELTDVTYFWSVSGAGWSIVSGQGTTELTYTAGAVGTTATISLIVTNNGSGCFSSCNIEFTAAPLQNSNKNASLIADDVSIQVYPNPVSDKAWIEFTTKENDDVTVEIYSLGGVLQKRLLETVSTQDTIYQLSVDGSQMSNGTYFCVIRINDQAYTRKLMIVK
jgi:hypothetical protein